MTSGPDPLESVRTHGDYDVIVAGGGSAGVAAAIAAARDGAHTLLIEKAGYLGGAATLRNVLTYCGLYTLEEAPRPAVGGIAQDVLRELRGLGALRGPCRFRGVFVLFDPEAVKTVLDRLCDQAKVDVHLHSHITGAQRSGDEISAVSVSHRAGISHYRAKAFVDATGECDLAALAPASHRYGNHGWVNMGTLATRFGGIPAHVDVAVPRLAEAIQQAKARGLSPLSKEHGLVVRLPVSGDLITYLASEDYDLREPHSLSRAEARGRQQAWNYLEVLRTLPGCERAYLVASGPEFGTRESRHLNARYQLRWEDVEANARFDDTIALGAWASEFHSRETLQSSFTLPTSPTYEIPLGCLMSSDTRNLFAAGRTADADQRAGASLRVMGTAFATGQAAGVAAACLAHVGQVKASSVRAKLIVQGALLDGGALPPPVELEAP